MDFAQIFGLISAVLHELPPVNTVVTDVTNTLKSASPLTPNRAVGPSETLKGIQRAINTFVKPAPLLVIDGLWGPKTETAVAQGLRMVGISV